MKILMDGGRLVEVVTAMAVLVEDAIARTVILDTDLFIMNLQQVV